MRIRPTLQKRRLWKSCDLVPKQRIFPVDIVPRKSTRTRKKSTKVQKIRKPDAPISKSQSLLILGRTKGTAAYEEMKDFHHETAAKAMSFLKNYIAELSDYQRCKAKEARIRKLARKEKQEKAKNAIELEKKKLKKKS